MSGPVFKLKKLGAYDLNKVDIIDVSDRANLGYGRRFVLKTNGVETKDLVFKNIFKRVQKLSHQVNGKPEDLAKLKSLETFITKLKTANDEANIAYNGRSRWYKIRTWFHRIFDFGSHLERLDVLEKEIQLKISESEKEIAICNAAKSGDVEAVRQLASERVNFNIRDADGGTPLGWAVANGHSEIVDILIGAGADVNFVNIVGQTPLFYIHLHNKLRAFSLKRFDMISAILRT